MVYRIDGRRRQDRGSAKRPELQQGRYIVRTPTFRQYSVFLSSADKKKGKRGWLCRFCGVIILEGDICWYRKKDRHNGYPGICACVDCYQQRHDKMERIDLGTDS